MSVKLGWEAVGTPLVLICRIHWLDTAANDWTPPSVLADGLGRSAPTRARNVGVAAAPDPGPAQTRLAACVASVAVSVPLRVTGLPETENIPGMDKPTDCTVPPATLACQEVFPEPSVTRTNPAEPLVLGNWKMAPPAAAGTRNVT